MKAILQENNQIVLTLPKEFVKLLKAKVGDIISYEMKISVNEGEGTIELLKLKKSNTNTIRKTLDRISDRLNENNYLENAGFTNEDDVIEYIRDIRRDKSSF